MASALGALGDVVELDVRFVGARVGTNGGGNGSGCGEREHGVQEVEGSQHNWPGERLDEVRQDAVEGRGQDTERSGKHSKVDLRVRLRDCCGGKRGGQSKRNDQEHEVEAS